MVVKIVVLSEELRVVLVIQTTRIVVVYVLLHFNLTSSSVKADSTHTLFMFFQHNRKDLR